MIIFTFILINLINFKMLKYELQIQDILNRRIRMIAYN